MFFLVIMYNILFFFSSQDDRVSLSKKTVADEVILTMIIHRTIRSDDGLYYCAGENKGAHVERAGHLQIECKHFTALSIKN